MKKKHTDRLLTLKSNDKLNSITRTQNLFRPCHFHIHMCILCLYAMYMVIDTYINNKMAIVWGWDQQK